LASEAVFGHSLVGGDPGFTSFERGENFLGSVADAGDNPQPCNDDAAHVASFGLLETVYDRAVRWCKQ
jgi:hypothetical protein